MKIYNVLITEKTSATLKIKARDAQHATEIAQRKIEDGILDGMIMDESDGYFIDDVQEA